MTDSPLAPLTDDVQRVLCVVAHPDDMEYGMSAAVAFWTARGASVSYLLLTHGEAGMQRSPEEAGPLRADEQRAACATVGVTDLTILDYPDGVLEPTRELRRDVTREIRRVRPDTILTMTWDIETPWGLNQADHRVAGLVTVDAIAAAGNPWIFPELRESGLDVWRVSRLLVGGREHTHALVVDESAARKAVASLECHRAYLADLPHHPAPAEFIPQILRTDGERVGGEFAVAFRRYTF